MKNNINILFLSRTCKEELWEYDFITEDLFPDNIDKKSYFMGLDDVRNTEENFDILVYSCRDPNNYPWAWMPTYSEVLECVLKTKPKIIIQLSDEFKYEDLQEHNNLGNYCKLFLRQYHHENYFYTLNTIHIPLAYKNGFKIRDKVIKPINERKYNWSFIGTYKSDRQELVDCFSKIETNKCILREESDNQLISSDQLVEYFIDSIFIPCSRGWSTIDTMRLYEASMAGSIPVLVSTREEFELVFKYEEQPPWIFAQSWQEASDICKNLLENKDELEKIQELILNWWKNRINKIKKIVHFIISE